MHNQKWEGAIRCLEKGNDTTKMRRCFKGRKSYWENCTSLPHTKDWRLFFLGSEEHDTVKLLGSFQKQTWDVGAGKGKTHKAVLNWWICPALVSTGALQAGSAGPVGGTTADLQGVHRHHLDPITALPSGWCIEDAQWKQMFSVSVSWMPASARLFEKSFWHEDVCRDRTFCLDPGLFLSHPDHLPHLYGCELSTSERLTHPLSGLPPCKLLWYKSPCVSEQSRCW